MSGECQRVAATSPHRVHRSGVLQLDGLRHARGALGAATARRDVRTVAIICDSAFEMTSNEILTIVRHGYHSVVIVLDNKGYGSERGLHPGDFKYNQIQHITSYSEHCCSARPREGLRTPVHGQDIPGQKGASPKPAACRLKGNSRLAHYVSERLRAQYMLTDRDLPWLDECDGFVKGRLTNESVTAATKAGCAANPTGHIDPFELLIDVHICDRRCESLE